MRKKQFKKSNGIALISALIILGVLVILTGAMLTFLERENFFTSRYLNSQKALALAEAGIDKAVQALGVNPSYIGETTELGEGTFLVEVTGTGETRVIKSTGEVANVQKIIQVNAEIAESRVEFYYGAQIGRGGLVMGNNSIIQGGGGTSGNVYSNGSISGGNRAKITGDVFIASEWDGQKQQTSISGVEVGHNLHVYKCQQSEVTNILSLAPSGINDGCTYGTLENETEEIPEEQLPISSEQITEWKNEGARNYCSESECPGGNYTVDINQSREIDSKKIPGNMEIRNNGTLTVSGVIWVVGNITIKQGGVVKLHPDYGESSGTIVADGKIIVENGAQVYGTDPLGLNGSYLMLLSTNPSQDPTSPAIEAGNKSDSAVFYANEGVIKVKNTANLKEVTSYKLYLEENSIVSYNSGLASAKFTLGPGSPWRVVRGTWTKLK